MVIKETSPVVQLITSAAPTGQYSYDASGALVYRRAALDWHQLQTSPRRSSCASMALGITAGRAQTWGLSSPRTPAAASRRRRYADYPCETSH